MTKNSDAAAVDAAEVEAVARAYVNSRSFWPVTWRFMREGKKKAIRHSMVTAIHALDAYRASRKDRT